MIIRSLNLTHFFLLVFSLVSLLGCNKEKQEKSDQKNSDRILPASLGKSGEMLVIMDTALWREPLGIAVKAIVQRDYPGILQGEPYYKVRNVHPMRMSSTLEKFRTLLYVVTLDNNSTSGREMQKYLSNELKQQMLTQPGNFMLLRRNVDAENQVVMILFHNYTDTLTELLTKYQSYLSKSLEQETVSQNAKELMAKRDLKTAEIVSNHTGLQLSLPKGFEIAKTDSQFIWIRSMQEKSDKSLVISWEDYLSQEQMSKTGMLDTRDMVLKPNLTGSGIKDSTSYMMTEEMSPVDYEVVRNSPYTTEIRGLWKLKNNSRGGSFVSRALLDERRNRVYYIEGLVYAPGQSKRDIIREFVAIMESIRLPS